MMPYVSLDWLAPPDQLEPDSYRLELMMLMPYHIRKWTESAHYDPEGFRAGCIGCIDLPEERHLSLDPLIRKALRRLATQLMVDVSYVWEQHNDVVKIVVEPYPIEGELNSTHVLRDIECRLTETCG
jgi:hypothetical protein